MKSRFWRREGNDLLPSGKGWEKNRIKFSKNVLDRREGGATSCPGGTKIPGEKLTPLHKDRGEKYLEGSRSLTSCIGEEKMR